MSEIPKYINCEECGKADLVDEHKAKFIIQFGLPDKSFCSPKCSDEHSKKRK